MTPSPDPSSRPTARSSDRVLTLLVAVVEGIGVAGEGGLTLTQLSDAVGLAPSTATRQLASLEAAGLVARTASGYVAGPRMVRLAHRVVGGHPLPRLAQPILDRVAAETRETCYLAVAHDEDTAIYLAAAEGTMTLRVAGWRGRDVPRSGTAVGRSLAGELPDGEAAVGSDTVEEGVTGISAPVRDAHGQVVAAVSVLGPTFRMHGEALEGARAAVVEGAAALGQLIGADGPGNGSR